MVYLDGSWKFSKIYHVHNNGIELLPIIEQKENSKFSDQGEGYRLSVPIGIGLYDRKEFPDRFSGFSFLLSNMPHIEKETGFFLAGMRHFFRELEKFSLSAAKTAETTVWQTIRTRPFIGDEEVSHRGWEAHSRKTNRIKSDLRKGRLGCGLEG
jgi:hypothetical protein